MGCLSRDYDAVTQASTKPHNVLTTHASIRAFHRVDVQQELLVRISKWGKENDVYAWP